MANLRATVTSQVKRTLPYPPGASGAPGSLRAAKRSASPQMQVALEATAQALTNLDASTMAIHASQRQPQSIEQILVTDNTGKILAQIGDFEYKGVVTPNYFSEIHVGDPLGTGNPAQALFNAAGGRVTIGQNGIVQILDPFGADAAWIGAQADTLPVTGAADNGSGLIRLTVVGHTLATGDTPTVMNVGGVPNATGIFTVTKIDADHIDLQNSVFVGAYTSGGTVNRILHIAGAANNGAGLIRIQTGVAHTYETGDKANVVAVGGVPNAAGQWILTVFDATHFDLQNSVFAGAYTSGGTCLRYFAGMLAQTFAIGPSFQNYKLRAFADGSLRIRGAAIDLISVTPPITDEISIDPATISIAVKDWSSVSGGSEVLIKDGKVSILGLDTSGAADPTVPESDFVPDRWSMVTFSNADAPTTEITPGHYLTLSSGLTTFALSKVNSVFGYTGATGNGPVIYFTTFRGTPTSTSNPIAGDTLGAFYAVAGSGGGGSLRVEALGGGQAKIVLADANGDILSTSQGVIYIGDLTGPSLTPLSGQLTIAASGSNQSIVLTPSGTGAIAGGTGTTSPLTLRSTTGVGTTGADIILQAGNNGARELARFTNGGLFGVNGIDTTVRALIKSGLDGLPVTSGTAQTDGALRLRGAGSGLVDFGVNGSVSWIQATDATDLSLHYNVIVNPRGGNAGASQTTVSYPWDVGGDINTTGVYRKGGTAGIGATRNMVASVATSAVGVFGTPGVGQVNSTVVTGVTLTSTTISGGIVTA